MYNAYMAAGSRYSDQQRREAVMPYLLHGNWRRVSELTRIPERTLNDWSIQPWFATMLAELRAEKGAEFDGALTRVLDEATKQLLSHDCGTLQGQSEPRRETYQKAVTAFSRSV